MNIFRTFWKSVKDLFDDLYVLALSNILWVLFNAPMALALLLFGGSSAGALIIILLLGSLALGPANAGLYTIVQRVTEGRTSSWRDFFAGVRQYATLSWKIYGLWMVGLVLILFNARFYSLTSTVVTAFLSVLFLYIAIVWFGILMYAGPLMLLQTDKRVRTIARNAALMTFGRPIFTLVTLILMALIAVVSIWLAILPLVATFAFLALWSFRATLTLIAEADARRAAEHAETQAGPARDKGRGGQIRPRD